MHYNELNLSRALPLARTHIHSCKCEIAIDLSTKTSSFYTVEVGDRPVVSNVYISTDITFISALYKTQSDVFA